MKHQFRYEIRESDALRIRKGKSVRQYYLRVKAGNGKIILQTPNNEHYSRKASVRAMAVAMIEGAQDTDDTPAPDRLIHDMTGPHRHWARPDEPKE